MSPGTATTSDDPTLLEVARHVVRPSGIVSSGWAAVERRCREFGDKFDRWQAGAGKLILAKRANGEYAATIGGVTISIPRQVVKTFLVGRIVFALATLFPGLRILWTAHHGATIDETFKKLKALALSSKVRKFMADDPVRESHGEQEIRFANGSAIRFGARGQGFALGFDKVDIVVFDEAQRLTERALDDMVATTNQSEFPAGALIFYMGTPPRPEDPSAVFKARRREALDVELARSEGRDVPYDGVYIETSADRGCDPDDQEQWKKGNPSFRLGRTPLMSMLRLRKQLVSVAAWLREGLGIWDDDNLVPRAITASQWTATGVKEAPAAEGGRRALGVTFSLNGDRLSLAGVDIDDTTDIAHGQLIDSYAGSMDDGLASLADWMAARWRNYSGFVLSGRAGATVLAELLRKRKVPEKRILVPNTPQFLQACAAHLDEITAGTITHLEAEGQTALDEAVTLTDKRKRTVDGGWSWFSAEGDHLHVEAISVALFGARTLPKRRSPHDESKPKGKML